MHTGVCKKAVLLREPLPCYTAASTPLQLLIWCFSCCLFPKGLLLRRSVFSQTLVSP